MFQKRKLLIILGSMAFSFGILATGYGFWTDSLGVEGKADVRFSVNVIDDIAEEITTSPEAMELSLDPAVIIPETSNGSSSSSADSVPVSSDPQDTTPTLPEQDTTPTGPEQDTTQGTPVQQEEQVEAPVDNTPADPSDQTGNQNQGNPETKPADSTVETKSADTEQTSGSESTSGSEGVQEPGTTSQDSGGTDHENADSQASGSGETDSGQSGNDNGTDGTVTQ